MEETDELTPSQSRYSVRSGHKLLFFTYPCTSCSPCFRRFGSKRLRTSVICSPKCYFKSPVFQKALFAKQHQTCFCNFFCFQKTSKPKPVFKNINKRAIILSQIFLYLKFFSSLCIPLPQRKKTFLSIATKDLSSAIAKSALELKGFNVKKLEDQNGNQGILLL